MRNIFLTVVLSAGITYNIFAQKLSPGYIVNSAQDTIAGFIVDGTDAELGLKIQFSKEKSFNDLTSYLPSQLRGFGFEYGRIFKCFYYIYNEKRSNDSVAVFAKKRIAGKITLYTFDKAKAGQPDFFLINNDIHRIVHLMPPKKQSIEERDRENFITSNKNALLLSHVKGDSLNNPASVREIRYYERPVKKSILKYNDNFKKQYPVSEYRQQIAHRNDATLGLPISMGPEEMQFRVAFYRHRYFPERSGEISIIRSVSYRHWVDNATIDSNVAENNNYYKEQTLNIVPIGINLHADSRLIRPYAYCGVGMLFRKRTSHNIVDFVDKGDQSYHEILPVFIIGAGVRIKIHSNFLLLEVTPAADSPFINIGYSF
jgi:hypothetical protein